MFGIEDHAVVEETCVCAQKSHLLRAGFNNPRVTVSNCKGKVLELC